MKTRTWAAAIIIMAALISTQMATAVGETESLILELGVVGPFTGPAANLGQQVKDGVEFAIDGINEKGGISIDGKKRQIEIIYEDSQSRPEIGISAAQKLLSRDKVDILMGDAVHSSVTLAIMELASGHKDTLFLSGGNTSPEISKKVRTDPEKYENFWKLLYNADAYANAVFSTAQMLIDDNLIPGANKTVAFFAEDSDWGNGLSSDLENLFEPAGWTVTMTDIVPIGNADFFPQISKLRANEPDIVVSMMTAANSVAALVNQLKEQGVKSVQIDVAAFAFPEFQEATGENAHGMLGTPLLYDPIHNTAQKEWGDRMATYSDKEATMVNLISYTQILLLFNILERAGSLDHEALTKAFGETNFVSLMGTWVFDPVDHTPLLGADYLSTPTAQVQDDGTFMVIWPKALATTTYKRKE